VKQKPDLSLEYKVTTENGAATTFGRDAIWHLRGPSWNSWLGLEAVKLAREAIGLAITLEQAQAEFQKNGAQSSGVLATKDKLSPERFELLSAWLDKHLPGGDRFGKPMIVDNAATYTGTSITATDQQLLETRKHQIEEICREFGVMPIMVGFSDKAATYASAEQMFLAHVVHTLSPWYQRIEQSADVNLLSEEEHAQGFYTKFTPNALMRGAANDRASFYAKGLGAGGTKGWLTQNDVRGFEEMDRSDDPEADKLPQPTGKTAAPADPTGDPNAA
jgi:HK97 family phage portal protein